MLSVELSVVLADDVAVIRPGDSQPDSPILDGKEWGEVAADSQIFLTDELNTPQIYTFQLSPDTMQDDGILIVSVSTIPNQGDFVFDGSSLIVETSTVPLTAAIYMFGSGLIGLIGIARYKKAA